MNTNDPRSLSDEDLESAISGALLASAGLSETSAQFLAIHAAGNGGTISLDEIELWRKDLAKMPHPRRVEAFVAERTKRREVAR